MTYDEVHNGQRVRITAGKPREGTVAHKAIVVIAGRDRERVYVDTDNAGRALCHPSVLEPCE